MRGLIIGGDGSIPVGPAGHVLIAGLALDQASQRVQQALQRYDQFAVPTLTLAHPEGRRITLVGSLERPGVYPVTPGLRLADVLALAGGPRSVLLQGDALLDADLHAARVVRNQQALPVSIARALQGTPHHNIYMHPGDLVWIPSLANKRVSVLGSVDKPAALRYRQGMRLTEALAAAGGASRSADETDVRIIRGPLSRPRIYRSSLADIVDGRTSDIELAPGDVVFVTEHWTATTTAILQRLTPLLIGITAVTALTN